jgi:hypothetical protein
MESISLKSKDNTQIDNYVRILNNWQDNANYAIAMVMISLIINILIH